jgi:hypothetical protein
MRHLVIAALIASPLLTAGCNNNSNADNASANVAGAQPAADLYVIDAGTITGNRVPGINSWFKIRNSQSGIESDRYGGACIIFRASDLGYDVKKEDCSTDDDCGSSGVGGYCHTESRQCWARPAVAAGSKDPYCKRSIDSATPTNQDGQQWNEGELNWISAQAIPVPQGLKPNAQARTLALLKTKSGMMPPLVRKWGDPKPIP